MRITNNMILSNTKGNINSNKLLVDKYNTQMTTQKKISKASENPVIAIRSLRLSTTMCQITQFADNNIPDAIAWMNVTENALTNMKDILTDDFVSEHGRPDVIILDPPRAGIHPDVAQVILNAAPERMVYVSCNPASQARDLEILCRDYVITAVRPVDMFPHTHHVENVVALKRR